MAYSADGHRIVSRSWNATYEVLRVRVWDGKSGECLEAIEGSGDVATIAAEGRPFPWRTMSRNLETVIEPAGGGDAIAWFPIPIVDCIATYPSGYVWAGLVGNHLYLIQLEGESTSKARGAAS